MIGASVALALAMIFPASVGAEFAVPPNDGFLTDTAGIIGAVEESVIEEKLQAYQDTTSNEIAVVILPSLGGYAIEEAALDIGRKWGVGSVKNNGILMLISYQDREIRIEVGYGLEGVIPDIVAKGIIDTDMTPNFRNGDYAGGVSASIDALMKHIGKEYTADRYVMSDESTFGGFGLIFIAIAFQWLIAILGRTKSWWLGGVVGAFVGAFLAFWFGLWFAIPLFVPLGLALDYLVSRNYKARGSTSWWAGGGWGPGGGGSFGGGGFGGFGGGSFGGGGASGRW